MHLVQHPSLAVAHQMLCGIRVSQKQFTQGEDFLAPVCKISMELLYCEAKQVSPCLVWRAKSRLEGGSWAQFPIGACGIDGCSPLGDAFVCSMSCSEADVWFGASPNHFRSIVCSFNFSAETGLVIIYKYLHLFNISRLTENGAVCNLHMRPQGVSMQFRKQTISLNEPRPPVCLTISCRPGRAGSSGHETHLDDLGPLTICQPAFATESARCPSWAPYMES